MQVEYVPIQSIEPYESNTRRHEEKDIRAIAESIKAFGFDDPIGVWMGVIVEGHGRWEAAKLLGLKEVPVIRLDDMTDEQRRAYAIAHNKTAEMSEWSYEKVTAEINSLDTNMALFGFWEKDEATLSAEEEIEEKERKAMEKVDEEKSDAGVLCPRCGAWVKK